MHVSCGTTLVRAPPSVQHFYLYRFTWTLSVGSLVPLWPLDHGDDQNEGTNRYMIVLRTNFEIRFEAKDLSSSEVTRNLFRITTEIQKF